MRLDKCKFVANVTVEQVENCLQLWQQSFPQYQLKTTNHLIAGSTRQSMFSGKILVGFQDNQLEYRASILFNRDPTWGEDFTSSTVPDWLK